VNPTLVGFIRKELLQTLREPRMRALLFVAPVIQLTMFGLAISADVRNIKLAVYASPHDRYARRLADRCYSGNYFVRARADGLDPFEAIQSGRAEAAIVAPAGGFGREVERGRGNLQLLVDATNAIRARSVEVYVRSILPQVLAEEHGASPPPAGIGFDVRMLYNPAMETSIFMVPGVLCMLLTMVTLILTSSSIAREKELGTFETLIAAPISKGEILLGKTVPYVLMGMADVPLILGVAVFAFGVPVRGPLWMLFLGSFFYVCTMVAIGTVISTITERQQQAMMASFLFLFPSQLLSGVMYPLDNMPWAIRWVTYLNPLRYEVTLLRNVMLKGGDPQVFWTCLGALFVLGLISIWFSFRRFHQTLN